MVRELTLRGCETAILKALKFDFLEGQEGLGIKFGV